MTGQCAFCQKKDELQPFQNQMICGECKKAGEQFLEDCSDAFMAEETHDELADELLDSMLMDEIQ